MDGQNKKIFLDASVLRVASPGNGKLLLLFLADALELEVCTSSYALAETLAALAEVEVPPKARIAVLHGLSAGILQGGWHVRLPEAGIADVQAVAHFCRDEADWPILADAIAESCDVLLTYDKDLLEADAPVLCASPDAYLAELANDPRISMTVQQLQALQALNPPPPEPTD